MSRWLLPAVLLVLASCGGPPIAATDQAIRVRVGDGTTETAVPLGRGFPLTVVRTWNKRLAPEAWDDGALLPLVVRLEATTRREDALRVEETRRFRAYAFSLADVRLPGVPFATRPKAGGQRHVVNAPPVTVGVVRALDPAAPGPPELPGGPLAEPPSHTGVALLFALLLASVLAAGFVLDRRRATPTVTPAVTAPAPDLVAVARLDRVAGRTPEDPDAVRADIVEVAAIVRDYVGERYAIRASTRTSEELVQLPGLGDGRVPLADLTLAADLVKFAAHAPTQADRDSVIAAARTLVSATRLLEGAA